MIGFFAEFARFVRARARYWLILIVILIALIAGLFLAVRSSDVGRVIYKPF